MVHPQLSSLLQATSVEIDCIDGGVLALGRPTHTVRMHQTDRGDESSVRLSAAARPGWSAAGSPGSSGPTLGSAAAAVAAVAATTTAAAAAAAAVPRAADSNGSTKRHQHRMNALERECAANHRA